MGSSHMVQASDVTFIGMSHFNRLESPFGFIFPKVWFQELDTVLQVRSDQHRLKWENNFLQLESDSSTNAGYTITNCYPTLDIVLFQHLSHW